MAWRGQSSQGQPIPRGSQQLLEEPTFHTQTNQPQVHGCFYSPTGSQYFLCLKSTRASTRQARTASCPDPARLPHTSQSWALSPACCVFPPKPQSRLWLRLPLAPLHIDSSGASSPPRGPAWPASHRRGSRVMSTLSCDDTDLSRPPLSQLYKLRPGHTSHSQDRGPRVRLGSGEVVVKAVRPEEPA